MGFNRLRGTREFAARKRQHEAISKALEPRMPDEPFAIVIIGPGIAGASAAAELARTHRVAVLEREDFPGYHSTGRSAALFSDIYGNPPVRALSRPSPHFF